MNKSIAAKLTQLSVRLEELNRLLSSESITANLDNYRKLTRERAEIAPVVELYDAYLQSERDVHTAQEMCGRCGDARVCRCRNARCQREARAIRRGIAEAIAAEGSQRRAQYFSGNPRRHGWRRIRIIRRRSVSHVCALCRTPALAGRNHFAKSVRSRRLQGDHCQDHREWRVFQAQVRIGRPSGAARARHRDPGAHPYFRLHRCGHARGGRGHGRRAQSRPSCGSILSAHPARAASTSTRRIPRCASRICRPGSWSSARMAARSTKTRRRQ